MFCLWYLTGTDRNKPLDKDDILKNWSNKQGLITIILLLTLSIDIAMFFVYVATFSSLDSFLNGSVAARSRWLEEPHAPFFSVISVGILFFIVLFWFIQKLLWVLFVLVGFFAIIGMMVNSTDVGRKLFLSSVIPKANLDFNYALSLEKLKNGEILKQDEDEEKNV